ncbi:hypothetical protein BG011_001464 [Mortierella polycephala]|uniref:Velvet domain-containing protein n=1 Tax=Mortierella polycephala TaxID=41804 RepID=A0A9P6U5X4_9FUNG|nr:hypothetical protein BG011_001464 [Mortierella polycephala]
MLKSDKYNYQPRSSDEYDDSDVDPNELTYSLEIVQQPLRARMCGFGDKDRRNVTPAPVLKLVAKTSEGRLISASHLSKQAFVVTADLWHEDETSERNLVLISSIPSSKTAAYAQQTHDHPQVTEQPDINQQSTATFSNASRMSLRNVINESDVSTSTSSSSSVSPSANRSRPIRIPRSSQYNTLITKVASADRVNNHAEAEDEDDGDDSGIDEDRGCHERDNEVYVEQDLHELRELERMEVNESERKQMSTRNLVGQIAVSGQIAPGLDDDTPHIWFAFSILSIRTEGYFKVRFCLTDLMRIPEGGKSSTICHVFSKIIHVQSPKKFEGTCDNNKIAIHLNKNCIRIPARKDEKKLNKNNKNNPA